MHVVEFASRTVITAEQKSTTSEKGCLVILWAIWKLHHYLVRAHFTLETNYKPLEWLESSRKSQACSQHLECWSLELRAYDFTVIHSLGKCNQTADSLLRLPVNLVASNPPLDLQQLSNAQHNDVVHSPVIDRFGSTVPPPNTGIWTRFLHKCYRQLWSQLSEVIWNYNQGFGSTHGRGV